MTAETSGRRLPEVMKSPVQRRTETCVHSEASSPNMLLAIYLATPIIYCAGHFLSLQDLAALLLKHAASQDVVWVEQHFPSYEAKASRHPSKD